MNANELAAKYIKMTAPYPDEVQHSFDEMLRRLAVYKASLMLVATTDDTSHTPDDCVCAPASTVHVMHTIETEAQFVNAVAMSRRSNGRVFVADKSQFGFYFGVRL